MTDTTTTHTEPPVLAPHAQLGVTRLAVRDIARSVPFFEEGLGLELITLDGGLARLGAGGVAVLELVEEPSAQPAGRHAGLFHVALLYPSRLELARVAQRLISHRIPIEGAADHGTHEALYLADPDGNGIELAADRPQEQWPDPEEEYRNGPQPLDVTALMSLVAGEPLVDQAAPGVRVGHMHLHVGDIDQALTFYRNIVGFELQARLPTAAFVSLGGYHHHLGMNVWKGRGVPPAPADAVGLRGWTLEVPSAQHIAELAARLRAAGIEHTLQLHAAGAEHVNDVDYLVVADPWNNQLRVEAQSGAA